MDKVLKAGKRAGIPGGTLSFSLDKARLMIERGYQLLAVGSDDYFLLQAAGSALSNLRSDASNVKGHY